MNPVRFPGAAGHVLAGRLHLPPGKSRGCALFAHCFTCGKDVLAASRIARRLSALGLAVLRFDFTGLGESEGEFAATDFSSNVQDLLAAAAFLRERSPGPLLLVGHSLGGAAGLAAAGSIADCRAVATIAATARNERLPRLLPVQESVQAGAARKLEMSPPAVTRAITPP